DSHVCARLADGTVECWGSPGQIDSLRTTPTVVAGVTNAISLSTNFYYSCGVASDGLIRCWSGWTPSSSPPAIVNGLANAAQIATADFNGDEYALLVGGGVASFDTSFVPVTVSGLPSAIFVTGGTNHACAVLSDGTARCWGQNASGQLGTGTTDNSVTPVS